MELTEVYNRNAPYWDSWLYRAAYHRAYVRLFRQLTREGLAGHPARVLDCGIGAGLFSEALLDAGVSPVEIHGIDLAGSLLTMARAKFARRGARLQLAYGDISRLPYRDEEMDLVLCALVLEHVRPADALREVTRVLRRGRPLVLVATRRGAPDHLFRVKYGYRPYRKCEILAWMEGAGLTSVRPHALSGIARLFARAYAGVKA